MPTVSPEQLPTARYGVFFARQDYETKREKGPVVDGDTFITECLISEDPRLKQGEVRIRVLGVDAPEKDTRDTWAAAREFTARWLESAQAAAEKTSELWPLVIRFEKQDSFGRWLAWVWRRDTGESLGDALIKAGHAKAYSTVRQLTEP